jgi:hypothetical protein
MLDHGTTRIILLNEMLAAMLIPTISSNQLKFSSEHFL